MEEREYPIESLFRSEYRKLLSYAAAELQNADLAQDVVQDTFHEAVRRQNILKSHPNPEGWLMTTLKYKIRDCKRSRNRYLLRFISYESIERSIPSTIQDPSNIPEESAAEILLNIQRRLKEEDYQLLKRIVFDRADHLTVSKELGISVWACQKRLERIRNQLGMKYPQFRKKKK